MTTNTDLELLIARLSQNRVCIPKHSVSREIVADLIGYAKGISTMNPEMSTEQALDLVEDMFKDYFEDTNRY